MNQLLNGNLMLNNFKKKYAMTQYQFNNALVEIQVKVQFYALRLITDRDMAEDLVQETLLKALSYRKKFRHNTSFAAWVHTIMRNTFINIYRRNTKIQKMFTDSTGKVIHIFSNYENNPSPDNLYNSKQIMQHIHSLEDDLRIPFLKFLEGLKFKEIAGEMNLPIGTLKSRIFYARRVLKKLIIGNMQ